MAIEPPNQPDLAATLRGALRAPAGATVISFDTESFETACGLLMRRVLGNERPDLIVGIPTGGRFVAEAMNHAASSAIPICMLTCRRPSTRFKYAAGIVRSLLSRLPRATLDRLRLIEHRLLTRTSPRRAPASRQFDQRELAAFDEWIARAGETLSVLVVDDAVDSGVTLFEVLKIVRQHAPTARVRSAVITVTSDAPLVYPDFALYYGQLCRFPWSVDAAKKRPYSS